MKKIKENYCYCSGITCALRESCKRWLPNPPDIKLWWIPVAYKQETEQCPHLDPINKQTMSEKISIQKKDLQQLPAPVTERIKTFEDACRELGEDHCYVTEYNLFREYVNSPDLLAYLKLRIVCAALNEDWEPSFTGDKYRWYPWFALYSSVELAEAAQESEEWISSQVIFTLNSYRMVSRGGDNANANYCLFCAGAGFASSGSGQGSRICFRSRELAIYAGRQFIELYADFNFIRK